jgi:hypothetical protein
VAPCDFGKKRDKRRNGGNIPPKEVKQFINVSKIVLIAQNLLPIFLEESQNSYNFASCFSWY